MLNFLLLLTSYLVRAAGVRLAVIDSDFNRGDEVIFCSIPIEDFCVDSKSFIFEAIGIWNRILTGRTG